MERNFHRVYVCDNYILHIYWKKDKKHFGNRKQEVYSGINPIIGISIGTDAYSLKFGGIYRCQGHHFTTEKHLEN